MKQKPTKERVKQVIDEMDDNLPDGAYWSIVHQKLGLEYGEVFTIMSDNPDYFGLKEVKPKKKKSHSEKQKDRDAINFAKGFIIALIIFGAIAVYMIRDTRAEIKEAVESKNHAMAHFFLLRRGDWEVKATDVRDDLVIELRMTDEAIARHFETVKKEKQ